MKIVCMLIMSMSFSAHARTRLVSNGVLRVKARRTCVHSVFLICSVTMAQVVERSPRNYVDHMTLLTER